SVAGTLNYGGALTIGNPGLTAPTTVTAGALVGAGAISVTGSGANKASLLVGSLAPGALTTSISLSNAQLQYGGGAITTIGKGGLLSLQAAQITIEGQSGNNSALTGLTEDDGSFVLGSGTSYSTLPGASFTNTGSLDLQYGGALSVSGNLTNSGALGLDDGTPGSGSSLTVGGNLTNTGTLNLDTFSAYYGSAGGGDVSVAGTLNYGGALTIGNPGLTAPTTVTAGALVGAGSISLSNAQLQYGGGAITTIGKGGLLSLQAAQITIEGQSGNNSALTGLTEDDGSFVLGSGTSYSTLPGASFTNTGSLDLQYGGALSVSGNLTNSGALGLDDGTPGSGSSLTVGGNLTNTGTFNLDTFSAYYGSAGGGNVSVAGTLNYGGALTIGNPGLTAPTTVTAGALVGAGAISVTGSGANKASLLVGSLAPGALTTSISLSNAQLQYGGGAITTIGKGGLLSLQAAQITIEGQSGNNSALTGLTEDDGSFVLGSGTSYSTLPGASFTNTGSLDLQYGGAAVGERQPDQQRRAGPRRWDARVRQQPDGGREPDQHRHVQSRYVLCILRICRGRQCECRGHAELRRRPDHRQPRSDGADHGDRGRPGRRRRDQRHRQRRQQSFAARRLVGAGRADDVDQPQQCAVAIWRRRDHNDRQGRLAVAASGADHDRGAERQQQRPDRADRGRRQLRSRVRHVLQHASRRQLHQHRLARSAIRGALSVSGNLTNSGALGLDDGTPGSGSSLTVGGNLTNTGTLNLDTFSAYYGSAGGGNV